MIATDAAPGNVSPLALRIAAADGIVLDSIRGSGHGGRILKADLARPRALSIPAPSVPSETTASPLDLRIQCKVAALFDLEKRLNASLAERDVTVSTIDLFAKAIGQALVAAGGTSPGPFGDERSLALRLLPPSAGLSGQLTIPVTGDMSLSAIAKFRSTGVSATEPGAITLRDVGSTAAEDVAARLDAHAIVALGIGAASLRPALVDGELGFAMMVTMTVRFDVRVIEEGAIGRFMVALREAIETPLLLLV